ncbi:MAG: cation-transporting P-type ATPase, partial [Desulfobacterales bacterium]|nr:cation-transporting P-type ATPase [Desulfobacterales bacterium]
MKTETYHSRSVEDVLAALEVSPEQGLSEDEVRRRLERHGRNKLREEKGPSAWLILLDQFKSVVILVLVAAGAVAIIFGQWPEGIAIAAVLFVNAALGFVTEWKALRSMEALRQMGGDVIRVRRGGQEREIDAEKLVPGDIVIVDAGDIVPADMRIIESNDLRVSEAALTGESVPVRKITETVEEDAPLAERTCLLYKGTTIAEGSGQGVVFGTGMATELGRISELAESAEKEATPLQRRLDRLGRRLAWITLAIAAVIAGVGLLAGQEPLKMIETAIALGVAAIPEGLPIVATIALARGMHLMARRNVLIKRLPAVETLGATQTIFTDKTGTLTLNRMTLQRVITPAGEFDIGEEQERGNENGHPLLRRVIEVGVLCNNAYLLDEDKDRVPEEEQGDPTETALLRAGLLFDIDRRELLEQKPEEREVAFDADRMMMATYHRGPSGLEVAVKGAPESVLKVCRRIAADGPEEARPLEDDERDQWIQRGESLAAEGLRLLAVADRKVESTDEEPYDNLRFLGLVGLEDPPREKVRNAVSECRAAGIRVVMVTGDKPATAAAIAQKTGVTDEKAPRVIHGSELTDPDEMSDEQRQAVAETLVFARVSPEQKLHLIKLMQEKGQ